MIRVGVIGLGMAAAPHAKSLVDLRDRVEVAGCFSPSPERRSAFAEDYRLPVVDSADALFDDPTVDAVIILTPPNTHLELVRRASQAGKHVLLEKPLEISLQRSVDLVEVAEQADIKLGIVLQHRFRPISIALREIVKSGRIGELVSASAKLYNWRPQDYYNQPGRGTLARDGGGVLLTQGIHTLDLMISLTDVPEEVSAYAATSPVHQMETEDLAFAAMRFANGALGGIAATTAAFPGYPDVVELIGTQGTARIDGEKLTVALRDGSEIAQSDASQGGGAGADPMAFSHSHHRAVIADFIEALEHDRQPGVTGREALKVHRLIDAILRSAGTGQRTRVGR